MRTWVLLIGVILAFDGLAQCLGYVVPYYNGKPVIAPPTNPTMVFGIIGVGVVLIVVSFFIKEKKKS